MAPNLLPMAPNLLPMAPQPTTDGRQPTTGGPQPIPMAPNLLPVAPNLLPVAPNLLPMAPNLHRWPPTYYRWPPTYYRWPRWPQPTTDGPTYYRWPPTYYRWPPVARRHANVLSTKAAQIPMALRHHERRVATRSAQTLEANMSHDTTNHPAHQRHAAFTPACFVLPSGTAPRKRAFHQGCASPNGAATSRTSCRHTVCPHTIEAVMRAFRTRLPPKVTRQVSKTSVSYETSSNSHVKVC